jgi:hypothetical protein
MNKMFNVSLTIGVILLGVAVNASASASTITTDVYGISGPWISSTNPSFNWGTSILPPTIIDSSSGLAFKAGDELLINYISGCVAGGWPGCYDANGWSGFGDLAGNSGPAYFIDPSKGPVYFMALLGAFTDLNDVIIGSPFKIGNGPFNSIIPNGASKLSLGFNDGGGGFFDNGGVIAMSITETSSVVPLPAAAWLFLSGIGALFPRFCKQAA